MQSYICGFICDTRRQLFRRWFYSGWSSEGDGGVVCSGWAGHGTAATKFDTHNNELDAKLSVLWGNQHRDSGGGGGGCDVNTFVLHDEKEEMWWRDDATVAWKYMDRFRWLTEIGLQRTTRPSGVEIGRGIEIVVTTSCHEIPVELLLVANRVHWWEWFWLPLLQEEPGVTVEQRQRTWWLDDSLRDCKFIRWHEIVGKLRRMGDWFLVWGGIATIAIDWNDWSSSVMWRGGIIVVPWLYFGRNGKRDKERRRREQVYYYKIIHPQSTCAERRIRTGSRLRIFTFLPGSYSSRLWSWYYGGI